MSFDIQSLDQSLSSLSSSSPSTHSRSCDRSPSKEPQTPKTPSRDSSSDLELNELRHEMDRPKEIEEPNPIMPKQEAVDFLEMSKTIKEERKKLLILEKEYALVKERMSGVMAKDGVERIDLDTFPPELLQRVGGLGTIEIRYKKIPYDPKKELTANQFRSAVAEGLMELRRGMDVDLTINKWIENYKKRHLEGKMNKITTVHRTFNHATSYKRKPKSFLAPIEEELTTRKKQRRNGGSSLVLSSLFEPSPSWFQTFPSK